MLPNLKEKVNYLNNNYKKYNKMVLITAGGDGSVFKFDPAIDSAILKELDEAEKQAKATAKV